MRHGDGAGTGEDKLAGPVSRNITCGDSLDISQKIPASQDQDWRARRKAAEQTLDALAELFPRCFVANRWEPHRPLARGIHRELVERGILRPDECRLALGLYVSRLQYQKALAAGGARVNLAGNPTDEVTAEEMALAAASVARIEAKVVAKAEAARSARQAAYRERQRAKQAGAPPSSPPSPANEPRRLGLADLKAAAAARRNGGAS